MRKSFFLVIALVLLVSGAAYAASITATLTVEVPSYIYLAFNNASASAEQGGTDTTIIAGADWTVPTGGPGTSKFIESGTYDLEVVCTTQWDLAVAGPASLGSTTIGATNVAALYWKFGAALPAAYTAFPAALGFSEPDNAATGATAATREVQFAVPYTWDVIPDTYTGVVTFTATAD